MNKERDELAEKILLYLSLQDEIHGRMILLLSSMLRKSESWFFDWLDNTRPKLRKMKMMIDELLSIDLKGGENE